MIGVGRGEGRWGAVIETDPPPEPHVSCPPDTRQSSQKVDLRSRPSPWAEGSWSFWSSSAGPAGLFSTSTALVTAVMLTAVSPVAWKAGAGRHGAQGASTVAARKGGPTTATRSGSGDCV